MCRPFCFNAFEQAYFKDILCVLHSPGIFHVLYTMLKRSRLMISISLIHVCLLLNALVSPTQAKSRVSYHLTIINTGHCYVTLAAHPCCPFIPHTKRFQVGQG